VLDATPLRPRETNVVAITDLGHFRHVARHLLHLALHFTEEGLRVRGRVEDVAVIGGRPLGLHLREEDVYIKR